MAQDASNGIPAGRDATIRPGDQIGLQIWREPDMSGTYDVDDGGEVTLPRLGTIRASDKSAGELQALLREEYAAYLRNPSVEVSVLRRVGVHGEVRRPELYMVDLTMTVRDLIARAGGVTEVGNPNNIVIVRGDEQIRLGRDEIARFATTELRSGDQVVVGRRNWFLLNPLAVISTAASVIAVLSAVLR